MRPLLLRQSMPEWYSHTRKKTTGSIRGDMDMAVAIAKEKAAENVGPGFVVVSIYAEIFAGDYGSPIDRLYISSLKLYIVDGKIKAPDASPRS